MRLTPVAINEESVRLNIALKASVNDLVKAYQAFYAKETGHEIGVSALIEQMIKDFTKDDKAFQKFASTYKAEPNGQASQ